MVQNTIATAPTGRVITVGPTSGYTEYNAIPGPIIIIPHRIATPAVCSDATTTVLTGRSITFGPCFHRTQGIIKEPASDETTSVHHWALLVISIAVSIKSPKVNYRHIYTCLVVHIPINGHIHIISKRLDLSQSGRLLRSRGAVVGPGCPGGQTAQRMAPSASQP